MKILVCDPIAETGLERLRQRAQVEVRAGLSPAELVEVVGEYQGMIVRSHTRVTREVITAGQELVVIGRAGTGVDNIDIEAATEHGIAVVNTPDSATISTAEHTIGLLLALTRHITRAGEALKDGRWERRKFLGSEIRGKTLGIIGLGRIGGEVAKRARAFEMVVIANDPYIPRSRGENLRVELVSLEELLRTSDFISLHVPLTSETRGMIGARELSMVKPSAYLINSARGSVVDEEALVQALREGRLAGAALDVFSQEPPGMSPLLASDKVVATPHLGASTIEAQASVATDIASEVLDVLEGRPALHIVNAPVLSPETVARLGPYLVLAERIGRLYAQTLEEQLTDLRISYQGELAEMDTLPLRAYLLKGLLEEASEERINFINADFIARSRGLRISEERVPDIPHYAGLLVLEAATSQEEKTRAGAVLRDESHIVRIDGFWADFVPTGYLLLAENTEDRPGILGRIGTILGDAMINISFMQVGRPISKGTALMVLGTEQPVSEDLCRQILEVPAIHTVKAVRI